MNQVIKINFADFYQGFNKTDNFIYNLLSKYYAIEIDEVNPDYLVFSCFGQEYLKYDCIRIFYTGENVLPDFNVCDYGTGYAYLSFGDRYIRYPDFYLHSQINKRVENKSTIDEFSKSRFCNFIYSNDKADPRRDIFFNLLNKYKKVDSAGKHLNDTSIPELGQGWGYDKMKFIQQYKFSIAFENSSLPGYNTEKILHAFIANTIPVYWGDPLISNTYNPEAFVNCHDYKSFEEVIDRIIELDTHPELYAKMLNQPIFSGALPAYMHEDFLFLFFANIFSQPLTEAARRSRYGYAAVYENSKTQQLDELMSLKRSSRGLKGSLKKMFNRIFS